MLLTMAGRCNANGLIFLTENIPYNEKLLRKLFTTGWKISVICKNRELGYIFILVRKALEKPGWYAAWRMN